MLSLFADEEEKAWRETDDADHLENIKPDGSLDFMLQREGSSPLYCFSFFKK